MKKNGFTLIELMIIVAIVGLLACLVLGPMFGGISDGTRSGLVTKLSYKGIFVKTWEGELMLGSGNSGDRWPFTAVDKEVADRLSKAQKSQKTVSLHYKQKLWVFPWQADTTYFVDKVE